VPDPVTASPPAAYVAEDGVLRPREEIYAPLASRQDLRRRVAEFTIPVRSGRAWVVPAGHVCRFSITEGPQVLDVNLWSQADPRERFWAARTRQFYGAHLTVGDRLWSNLPFLRPLATIVADSLAYGIDADGAGAHDLLGTRCDPYVNQLLAGKVYDFHCHSNLVRAVAPFGLTEFDVHDVINVFQVTGLRREDERYFMKSCPAAVGDHLELFAEIDLLVAASTCPGGDLSVPLWGPGSDAEPTCNPIGVEVFALADELLVDWSPPAPVPYRGTSDVRHGYLPPPQAPPLPQAIEVRANGDGPA
jgi:uncharacterized protein